MNVKMTTDLLIHHHVNCILESRLLLDEDVDVIITNLPDFKSKDANQDSRSFLCSTIMCCTSCLTGLYLTYKYNNAICAVVSSVPLSISIGLLVKNKLQQHYFRRNMEGLIRSFTEVHVLNKSIINYFQTRNAISFNCTEKVFNCISEEGKGFLHFFSSEMINFLKIVKNSLEVMLSEICEKVDYSYLEQCDLDQFKFENIVETSDCLINLQKIIDVTVLLISNFLSSLAMTFFNKHVQIGYVFNNHVIEVLKKAKKTVKCIRAKFDSLRFYVNAKSTYKSNQTNKKMPTKISQPLSKLLTHMQITFEMTQTIYNQLLQQDDIMDNVENLNAKLLELKNHFNACHNFLDSFIKMYGILFKSTIHKGNHEIKLPEITKKESTTEIIRWDDNNEPEEDEEFDMYIDKDFVNTESNYDYDDEANGMQYLSIIIQELQQNLKERQAILASRKKKYTVIGQVKKEDNESPVLLPYLPPPPPLPMPLENSPQEVTNEKSPQEVTNEKESFQNNELFSGDFVSAIKLMAQQRTRPEETFGDDFESDDEVS